MKNVGEFDKRNAEYDLKFNRDEIIKKIVSSSSPVIFDVGAHHGQSVTYLKGLFPQSKIFSFEPDPESFNILSENTTNDINTKVFNLAISDTVGKAKFYKNEISHTNSLYKVNLESNDSISISKSVSLTRPCSYNFEVEVEMTTLDRFVHDNSIDNIDLLKIDVQGAEEKVLSGGGGALQNTSNVIVEVSFYDYYEKNTSFMDVEKYLIPAGFKLFSILDISRNPMNGRTDWAEVLYTRVK